MTTWIDPLLVQNIAKQYYLLNEQMTQPQKQFKVLLIGDVCRDVSLSCSNSRVNPEDPKVPLVTVQSRDEKLGMAAFVGECLLRLGLEVSNVFPDIQSLKSRYYIDHSSTGEREYILRVDDDIRPAPVQYNSNWLEGVDAVAVSDYNKGFVSKELLDTLDRECGDSIPLFVDTKKRDLSFFQHAVIKINADEASRVTNWPLSNRVIVTYGATGARYCNTMYPAYKTVAKDVCGAGDSFLAGLVYGYLTKGNMSAALDIANKCAAISVGVHGTHAPCRFELKRFDNETIR